jgi:excisionase family DNA binding protein
MRFRVRITRGQVAERTVSAIDEEAAVEKIRAELDRPYGFLGLWKIVSTDVEIVAAEPVLGTTPKLPGEGPLLLSVKDAADHMGIGRSALYGLVASGEIETVDIGRRRYISREALTKFIEVNTRPGLR